MKQGICSLCLLEKELCRSHILPQFFHEILKEQEGAFWSASGDPLRRLRKFQTGKFEYLFCKECEGIISRYETHASLVLPRILATDASSQKYLLFKEYDYIKFKLFGLSLIYRFHVSKREHPEVNLGPHAEKIRKMLRGSCGEK